MFKSHYILGAEREKSYFRKYIHVLTKIKTISNKRYYETKFEESKSDLRQIWNTIRSVLPTNRKNVTATSPCLQKINDCSVSAPHDIANYLNDFFSTIGSKLADRIDNSSKRDHFSYLTRRISSSIFLDIPSMTEINNAISSLNINKSYGHDQIPPYFLRIASPVVTPFLHLFVQFSFTNGIFPKNCTIAKIIPIFKKGNRQSPTNYRPISILTYFSKIFEKLIHTQLTKFWTKHKVLTTTQYGFQSKLSTTHALLHVITSSFENVKDNLFTGLILLDLAKAFDTVSHDILLSKLDHYGIRGTAKDLLQSFLKRKQFVFANGCKSSIENNNYGVAQGSTLGPLLFLIYAMIYRHLSIASPDFLLMILV